MRAHRPALALTAAAALTACGSARDFAESSNPQQCAVLATGATCPPSSTLTYASFGQAFFGTYCTRCHASTVTGDARHGATIGVNFDSLQGIRDHACTIDSFAGSGPSGTFTFMPFDITALNPDPPEAFPTVGERVQLSQWIACGSPP
jgi:cytochrome c5